MKEPKERVHTAIKNTGEATLAHHNVLFLDELPELRKKTLGVLCELIEDFHVTVSHTNATHRR